MGPCFPGLWTWTAVLVRKSLWPARLAEGNLGQPGKASQGGKFFIVVCDTL